MINLTEHIEHLIVRNDCVIVPGFGAFIAEKVPAYINKESGTFMPPSRRLSFNPRIDHNDGMLVTSLMRRHRWSYALASESLGDCVAALKSRLASAGTLTVGSLGTLRYQDEATPEFIPSAASAAVNPYGVLPALEIIPIKQLIAPSRRDAEKIADAVSAYDEDFKQKPLWLTAARSVYSRVAVAVAVIATCVFTYLSPTRTADRTTLAALGTNFTASEPVQFAHDLYISYPDPESATATVKPSVPEPRDNTPKIIPASDVTTTAAASQASAPAAPAKPRETATPSVPAMKEKPAAAATQAAATSKGASSYILVVASLTSDIDAHAFIRQSGDNSLKIKKMGSRYRVYSEASDSKDALVAKQPSTAARYPGAWVCEVK